CQQHSKWPQLTC
nr:immunoglobulin light chain junction region [Macaca mulatta]MPN91147.1 immunoglobulin light chain junction region [Macaca mulatta]MPN91697.1 immunoglobulin light chain junction region [Macaca mulatta]MPN92285.1 immunoglobulin light chain junction region [Macaca mulatta]MPN97187.1 immunoglobulin light chain junction region [Macaca mulatta]